MSETGKRLIEGAQEALAVARGEEPAASITMSGYTYYHAPRGSRILAPGQIDPYTIERCAEVADSYEPRCDTCPSGVGAAIRALGKGPDQK